MEVAEVAVEFGEGFVAFGESFWGAVNGVISYCGSKCAAAPAGDWNVTRGIDSWRGSRSS